MRTVAIVITFFLTSCVTTKAPQARELMHLEEQYPYEILNTPISVIKFQPETGRAWMLVPPGVWVETGEATFQAYLESLSNQ